MLLHEIAHHNSNDAIVEAFTRDNRLLYQLLTEGGIQIAGFTYDNAKTDPKPRVLVLTPTTDTVAPDVPGNGSMPSRFVNPKTKTELVCGINLNYLTNSQKKALWKILPQVAAKDSTKARYWEVATLLPDVIKAYRTYNSEHINAIRIKDLNIEPAIPEPEQQAVEPLAKPAPEEKPVVKQEPDEQPKVQPKEPIVAEPKLEPKLEPEPESTPIPAEPEPTAEPSKPTAPAPAPQVPEVAPRPQPVAPQPQKKPGVLSKIGGAIKRFGSAIKNKLFRNKEIERPKLPPTPEIDKNRELTKLGQIEQDHTTNPANELDDIAKEHGNPANELDDIAKQHENPASELDDIAKKHEDEHPQESFEQRLNTILERYSYRRPYNWTNEEYVYWHHPERFFEYNENVRSTILEHADGCQLLAIYNIIEDRTIIDLANSLEEMLHNAGWDRTDTIRFYCDGGRVRAAYNNINYREIAEQVAISPLGHLLVEVNRS